MGLRLELLLIAMILSVIALSLNWKLSMGATEVRRFDKELEFTNTTFIEVDQEKMLGFAYSSYGVGRREGLEMNNIVYHTEKIESLEAKKAYYKKEILYLEGDVVMKERDGYHYQTQYAQYDQKTEILEILSPFKATRGENVIKGGSLRYDALKKELFCNRIDAVLEISKGEEK